MPHGGSRPRHRLFTPEQVIQVVLRFPAGDAHPKVVAPLLGISEHAASVYLSELVDQGLAYRELHGRRTSYVIYPAFDPRTYR
jgi:predicted transcriptional regulator